MQGGTSTVSSGAEWKVCHHYYKGVDGPQIPDQVHRSLLPSPASEVICSPVPIFSLSAPRHTQALERQKEFFDSVRSERDDLREEVVMLKEELKV